MDNTVPGLNWTAGMMPPLDEVGIRDPGQGGTPHPSGLRGQGHRALPDFNTFL